MKKNLFFPALNWIEENNESIYGPVSFQDYLSKYNLKKTNTATHISVDSLEKLNPYIRNSGAMVFRLGAASNGTGTQFALIKHTASQLKDFFLIDEKVFTNRSGQIFKPDVDPAKLLPYKILTSLSESSLVNLGLSSGLIGKALGFSGGLITSVPATSKSTFTFEVKLHSEFEQVFLHNNGQVEIDALLVEKQNGQDTLFVFEAKHDDSHRSLAKHKLVYPILALADRVPAHIPIVPVYIKIKTSEIGWHYHIVECDFPDPRNGVRAINELQYKRDSHFILPFTL